MNEDIINIALTHHERFDGSGYPGGLVGTQTPVYGRIAGVIDSYNAMISHRPYSEPQSQHKVLQQMYNWRNKLFQDELVEQFLQCLGVYPTGSLVELNTGEVAIVVNTPSGRQSQQDDALIRKTAIRYDIPNITTPAGALAAAKGLAASKQGRQALHTLQGYAAALR